MPQSDAQKSLQNIHVARTTCTTPLVITYQHNRLYVYILHTIYWFEHLHSYVWHHHLLLQMSFVSPWWCRVYQEQGLQPQLIHHSIGTTCIFLFCFGLFWLILVFLFVTRGKRSTYFFGQACLVYLSIRQSIDEILFHSKKTHSQDLYCNRSVFNSSIFTRAPRSESTSLSLLYNR